MKIFIVLYLAGLICAQYQPEQVHLALTGNPDEMMISWVTYEGTTTSTVQYGVSQDTLVEQATGSYTHYYLPLYESPALHTVKLEGLKPNTVYYYKCGDASGGWSQTFYFTTENPNPVTPKNPLKIAIMADNGATSNSEMVLNAMTKADQSLHFDLLILSGDLSYANGWQPTWDYWGNLIQPLASHFPFMVAPGNHELFSLFIAYNARFTMPNNGDDNLYYSFNYRNVHVLILNSMSVNEYHWSTMYQYAEKDLKAVNKEKTPWIFAAFHHPWYCSNLAHNDSAWFMKEEYEDLFHKYNVNLVLQGHVHAYERTNSVYKWKEDPTGAVYVTNGHAGNGEGLYYGWQDPQPSWSAYRESVYGFSTIEIFNNTHLHWQMIRGNDSLVSDDFWFVKP